MRLGRHAVFLAEEAGDEEALPTCVVTLATALLFAGLEGADDMLDRAERLVRAPQDILDLLTISNHQHLHRGEIARALEQGERLLGRVPPSTDPVLEARRRALVLERCWLSGDDEGAEAAHRAAEGWAAQHDLVGHQVVAAVLWNQHAPAPTPEGRVARLEGFATVFRTLGDHLRLSYVLAHLSDVLMHEARFDEALAVSREAGEVSSPRMQQLVRATEAQILLRMGRFDAFDRAVRALPAFGVGDVAALGAALRAITEASSGALSAADAELARLVQRPVVAGQFGEELVLGARRLIERGDRALLPRAAMLLGLAVDAGADGAAALAPDLTPIPCGRTVLTGKLGQGGHAAVWSALWPGHPEPVAVKTALEAGSSMGLRALQEEVGAVCSLRHAAILPILDSGVTTLATEVASGGRIARDVPWLLMPLARGGTLERFCGRLPWMEVRGVLASVLLALSYAHGRGVLHLDLKPQNILLSGTEPALRPMLADFGLAHWMGRAGADRVAGTPHYMAPEQSRGDHRAWGPHTDLYAMGCVAWTLVTGAEPFGGLSAAGALRAQVTQPIPAFAPATEVPAGLETWLRWLLEKAPRDRPISAAEARAALLELGAPVASGRAVAPAVSSAATFAFDDLELPELPPANGERARRFVVDALLDPPAVLPPVAPHLLAGLHPPLVTHQKQREVVWSALRSAASGAQACLEVRGLRQVGVGPLARWTAERARRAGMHTLLVDAECSEALRTLFRAHGLADDALRRHLHQTVWRPAGISVDAAVKALSGDPHELQEVLLALARDAPTAVVLLPSASSNARRIARTWAASVARGLLLIATLSGHLGAGEQTPTPAATHSLWLEAVPRGALRDLAAALLPLDPATTGTLVRRAAGYPGLLVQTLRAWARAHRLVLGPEGLRVIDDRALERQLALTSPMATELELWFGADGSGRAALELLALMGPGTERTRWEEACRRAQVELASAQVRRLVEAGAVADDGGRLTLTLPDLVRVLEASAVRSGRAAALHRAAAEACHGRPAARGRHLLEAGSARKAAHELLLALGAERDAGERMALARDHRRALELAGFPRTHPTFLDAMGTELEQARTSWSVADRRVMAARYLEAAEAAGHARHRVRAAWLAAETDDDPVGALERALGQATTVPGVGEERTAASMSLAAAYLARHDAASALRVVLAAAAAVETGDPNLRWLRKTEADCLFLLGRYAEADRVMRGMLGPDAPVDSVTARLHGLHGETLAFLGDLDAAEAAYRRSLELGDEVGDLRMRINLFNILLLDLARDRVDRVLDGGEQLRPFLAQLPVDLGPVVDAMLLCAPHPDGWAAARIGPLVARFPKLDPAERRRVLTLLAGHLERVGRLGDAAAVRSLVEDSD